ncbi:RHS repeat-associated core domain-containing protein [Pseudomonas sp. G(2018)]|uniref:RHS repeat-associated core domain-containing protein n=1 Tax=Pseudomonas sp. G(2018) TaxID=2502242 RepID=UPI0021151093|nr:RHS repeat-associated core domain-containing protein [Pseudomonas sp. G(2018)]
MPTHSFKTILLATDQQRSVLNALHTNRPHPIAYTPYGHRPRENGWCSLLGFNGEPPDPLTGHYHLGNGYRQFNPVLMRFNSPDSWSPFGKGGLNAYSYCGGDPVNRSDPTGHMLEGLRSFLRKNIRVSAAKPPKTTSKNGASSNPNASSSAGVSTPPHLTSKNPSAEFKSQATATATATATTKESKTASTGQPTSVRNLDASDITRNQLLNRRTKSLGHISEDFNDDLDRFYLSKQSGTDGGFFTTQFAANPRGPHAKLYYAMDSERLEFPTPAKQRTIRTGGHK